VVPEAFTVTVAVRVLVEVFGATFTLIEALPFPDVADSVTHVAEADAVHDPVVVRLIDPGTFVPLALTFQVLVDAAFAGSATAPGPATTATAAIAIAASNAAKRRLEARASEPGRPPVFSFTMGSCFLALVAAT
jgi:hypothetical protein